MFFLTIPVLILILLFSEFILSFFGEQFVSGVLCLNILIAGQLINVLCGSVGYILNMTEHQNVFKWIIIFSVLIFLKWLWLFCSDKISSKFSLTAFKVPQLLLL